jgi:hypothetical protein
MPLMSDEPGGELPMVYEPPGLPVVATPTAVRPAMKPETASGFAATAPAERYDAAPEHAAETAADDVAAEEASPRRDAPAPDADREPPPPPPAADVPGAAAPPRETYTVWSSGPATGSFHFGPKDE